MIVQKLPWAGIRIESGGTAVAIDPLYHFPAKFGRPREPMRPLSEFGPVDAVFVTHCHDDHFDPEAIAAFYGAGVPVHMPAGGARSAGGTPLSDIRGAENGDEIRIGTLKATATWAVDGVGDPQLSWIVTDGSRTVIHCGDTLWHGYWWKIAAEYGPFDAALLPVNGAVVELPGLAPSGQPISMTPEQAAAAAKVLRARRLVPIHWRTVHHPPVYRETPGIESRLKAAAGEHGLPLSVLQTGEAIRL
jgi:L-ascorbate metabolism protein UlaG (beta-lactamase superfamily)